MPRSFSFAALSVPRQGNALFLAAVTFALGLTAGVTLRSFGPPSSAAPVAPALAATSDTAPLAPFRSDTSSIAHRLDPQIVYPADVIRIIDGDTFEARVRVWPGLDVDTKVRLRGVDAAELHARCAGELQQAQAARTALENILAEGGVTISRVGIDKYGGRVDATIATRNTADVSAALLKGGYARAYDGGRRGSWCG